MIKITYRERLMHWNFYQPFWKNIHNIHNHDMMKISFHLKKKYNNDLMIYIWKNGHFKGPYI